MQMFFRVVKRWALCGVALISLNCEAGGSGASFERVIENRSRYHHKRVTIYGRAKVQGSGFELRSLHNTSRLPDESQVIHVVWRDVAANYDRFNDRPVVITGVIDTSERGLWGYRCGIWLERISVLHPSPEREARGDGTLLKQMQETIVRVRTAPTLDLRADAAEHAAAIARKMNPLDIDDKTLLN